MTRNQISKILGEIGFSLSGDRVNDIHIYEDMDVVQSIILDLDESVYPGRGTCVEFYAPVDERINLLLVYKKVDNNATLFTKENKDKEKYLLIAAYPFELIEGIALVSAERRKYPYELGQVM